MKFKKHKFKGKVWKYKGPAAWHFVTLPKTLSIKIRKNYAKSEEGATTSVTLHLHEEPNFRLVNNLFYNKKLL